MIAERNLVEPAGRRAETFEIFGIAAGSERGQRAAVEGALDGDDPPALRMARRRSDSVAPP